MSDSAAILEDLLEAIRRNAVQTRFSTEGALDSCRLDLEIEEIGKVKLPLRPKGVRELLAAAQTAPYGKGTETLIDLSVRDSMEIDASKIVLSTEWETAVGAAATEAAANLGLPADQVEAKLYKLLIYQKGGFFLPHRDNEKRKNMVGSMVVMLPSSFGGGELVVKHGGARTTFAFEEAANGQTAEYAAFYADCEHEVRKVTRGVRVCLHYNLMLKPQRRKAFPKKTEAADSGLVAAVSNWITTRSREPMVFPLEHQYTADGLKPDLLKGNDRAMAKQIRQAAVAADCRFYFGQVSWHLSQFADDGSFGYRRGWSNRKVDISNLSIGETYEDELVVGGWKDSRGNEATLGRMSLESSMLVSTIPLDQWKPTREEYEGYNGNAGNTLDRWYQKSAIVLWAEKDHFDILVRMGMAAAVATLKQMTASLPELPEAELEQACIACDALTRAIIRGWPDALYAYADPSTHQKEWAKTFTEELLKSEDPDLVGEFLQTIARRDRTVAVDQLVVESCQQFGVHLMFPILKKFLATTAQPRKYGLSVPELFPRDAAWICSLACDHNQGGLSPTQCAALCRSAVQRYSNYIKEYFATHRWGTFDSGETLTLLMKTSLAAPDEESFAALLDLKTSLPQQFDMRTFDVITCPALVQWADKKFDQRPAALVRWLDEIREFLAAATKALPQPPKDFARPAETRCSCDCCIQLADFLQDPALESGVIKSLKAKLEHVQRQIADHHLDAESKIDRSTRPFSLVLKKTLGSHERAVKQYHQDLELLNSLPQSR